MEKYSFMDDYSEGCHPDIIEALSNTNLAQQAGYGNDAYSDEAKLFIQQHLKNDQSTIYFVSGGTLANLIIISATLKSHEAVISVETGHIIRHEAGAIEATGHKVITMPGTNGKLTTTDVQAALDHYAMAPHMVKPRLVYISNATEIGTIYTKSELEALSIFCREKNLYLFMDGARLATALCCEKNDVTLNDLATLTDIFYIGGTKNGALLGEAIVINHSELSTDFLFHIKQRGAMMAKGRLLGIQFLTLFKYDLYFQLATHANAMANMLSKAIVKKGFTLSAKTETNQIFPILPNTLIEKLEDHFAFYVWQKTDDTHSIIRLVTSWATDEEQVKRFIDCL